MKRLLIIIVAFFAIKAVAAANFDELWNNANAAYYENDFNKAIALYDSIEQGGMVSAKLYYNMGNAYFKAGRIGKSILYYNKAERLAPGDKDIEHNLAIANTHIRNRIEPLPEFFLRKWMNGFSSIMGGNAWAVLSIVFFALTLTGALIYLLPLRRRMRKTGFYGGLASLVIFLFAFSFAAADRRESRKSTQAIVTSTSVSVKSSPDYAGKDLFLLYEGAKVKVLDALNGWREIELADGNQGWIKAATIEMID